MGTEGLKDRMGGVGNQPGAPEWLSFLARRGWRGLGLGVVSTKPLKVKSF